MSYHARQLAVAMLLLLPIAAFAVPSKYVKQKAVKAAAGLEEAGAAQVARFAALKEQDLLDEPVDGSTPREQIGKQLRNKWLDAFDTFGEAIADGWTEDDAELTKARETMQAVAEKWQAVGMWTLARFGEKPINPQLRSRMETIRDHAADAAQMIREKKVDEATAQFEQLDKRMQMLRDEAKRTLLEGNGDVPADLPKHPAFERVVKEVTRLKGSGAEAVQATTDAREAIDKEVADLQNAYDKGKAAFEAAERALGTSGTEQQMQQDLAEQLEVLNAYDKEDYPAAVKLLEAFTAKYGNTSIDVENNLAKARGTRLDYNPGPGWLYDQLRGGLDKIKEAHSGVAGKLLADVQDLLKNIGKYSEFIRVEMVDKQKAKLDLALQFDPDNAEVKALLADLPNQHDAVAAAIEKATDARVWKPNDPDYAGPGKPAELLAESRKWLMAHREEGDESVVRNIRIDGDWFVFEKDALGQPAAYGLRVMVAWQSPQDKAEGKDLVTVFELSMVSRDAK
ncbi:MAG: hypothetical protein HYU66_15625, partial [Armatimonadetes bacterium]|nr:hypothetical protein [Armatimonadota bacterium]